jgi:curved DNA-binding protein CbpA
MLAICHWKGSSRKPIEATNTTTQHSYTKNHRSMSTFVNHYSLLGVSQTASPVELADAWELVLRAWTSGHLDVDDALLMKESYKILSNAEDRARFDRQLQRKEEERELKSLRAENEVLSAEKRKLEEREKALRRKSEQQHHEVRALDAGLRHQEKVNDKLRQSLERFHLGSPKLKKHGSTTESGTSCRFCGKETSRVQSLRQHLTAMSTDMLCVERKILYLLQSNKGNLSNPDYDLLDGICSKLAKASDEKIRGWEAKVPTLIAFQAKFAEEIAVAD